MCVGVNIDVYVGMHAAMDDSNNDVNYSNNNNNDDEYVVNVCMSDVPFFASTVDSDLKYMGMLDSGANVNIATLHLAVALGLPIADRDSGRQIGTADKGYTLQIHGWINVGGYIGKMAVVEKASFSLLPVSRLQRHGLGRPLPARTVHSRPTSPGGILQEVEQCQWTHLYYVNVRPLVGSSVVPLVLQAE